MTTMQAESPGHVHSSKYEEALTALDSIKYRYELYVGSDVVFIRFWRTSADLKFKAVASLEDRPLSTALDVIGERVLEWVAARQSGNDTGEFL